MPQSLAQKIIARASGQDVATIGEIVTCRVDLALLLDSGGPRRIWPRLKELGVRHEWRMLEGKHTFDTVRQALPMVIEFMTRSLEDPQR